MSYADFKSSVLGHVIGDGQCVALVVNNSGAYSEYLFPGISWTSIFPPVPAAKQLLADANGVYFQRIDNNHNDPNQLPQQGDVMVFDATPQAGYTNTYDNPYGHTGICESADANGYVLLQQNSPYSGAPVNATHYPWHYRPCLGWLRPIRHDAPVTPPQEVPSVPAPQPVIVPLPSPAVPVQPAPTPVETPAPVPPVETPTPTDQASTPPAPQDTQTTPTTSPQTVPTQHVTVSVGTPSATHITVGGVTPPKRTLLQAIIEWLKAIFHVR